MNDLIISFDGMRYSGADVGYCFFCGKQLRHEWIIHENKSGHTIRLCEKHYKEWQIKRDKALEEVSDVFRSELKKIRHND